MGCYIGPPDLDMRWFGQLVRRCRQQLWQGQIAFDHQLVGRLAPEIRGKFKM